MPIIDAHIHYGDSHPALTGLLAEFDVKLLNISLAEDNAGQWREPQVVDYQTLAQNHPDRYAWCTSFDLPRFDDANYVAAVIHGLRQDFEAGAIACKIWKNIGLEVKDPAGRFFMVDDPLFEPILDYLAQSGRTLLTHIAEPLECWQPLRADGAHYGYYSQNPQWHMFNKPHYPSHQALIAARDRVLAKHPKLRMVGAHLGSLEYDVAEVATRLDRYPNFAVDISARLLDLALQDSSKVRRFFIKYQDRILFGTDVVMRQKPSAMAEATRTATLNALRQIYQMHFAYVESTGPVTVRGREAQGLGLPSSVLEKFYYQNALAWYPGV